MNSTESLLLESVRIHIWIARRTDSQKGCGTHSDPYAANTATAFDLIMRTIVVPKTTVHLGPGDFHTLGYSDESPTLGWEVKAGIKLLGSGIGVTNLYLDLPASPVNPSHHLAIGHSLTSGLGVANKVDFTEISDLSILCPAPSAANTACSGIRLLGNHTRVRRVQVTGWGSQTSLRRAYGIACGTALVSLQPTGVVDINTSITNTGVEDCLVMSPAVAGQPAVGIHVGPVGLHGILPFLGVSREAFGLGAVIRNCFVDCLASGQTIPSSQVTGISVGWCRGLVVDANQVQNAIVAGPYANNTSIQDIVVSNNYYRNVRKGPFLDYGPVGPTATLASLSATLSGTLVTATANFPAAPAGQVHLLSVGDRVQITGAIPAQFNGTYEITEVVNALSVRFTLVTKTLPSPSTASTPGSLGKLFGTGRVVIENNVVELATGGTDGDTLACHLHDGGTQSASGIFIHTNVLIRNNKFRYLDGAPPAGLPGRAVEVSGAKNLIIRDNIAENRYLDPLRNQRCGSVRYSNNRTPVAALIRGANITNGFRYDDIEIETEDAMVLSLIRRRR